MNRARDSAQNSKVVAASESVVHIVEAHLEFTHGQINQELCVNLPGNPPMCVSLVKGVTVLGNFVDSLFD